MSWRILEIFSSVFASGDVPQWDSSISGFKATQGGFVTGDIKQNFVSSLTGWVLLNGSTIGSASSGATQRANADCEALFVHLWDNLANTEAPVSSGRGASGAADFAANKTITLPDMRQKFPIGKAASGSGSTIGGTGGAIDHSHSVPAHYHGVGTGADINITSSGTHNHGVYTKNTLGGTGDTQGFAANGKDGTSTCVDAATSTTGAHTHAVGNFSGRIGLVTGGVNGNAAMTSGSGGTGATGAGGTGATGASGTDPTGAGGTGATSTDSSLHPVKGVYFVIKY